MVELALDLVRAAQDQHEAIVGGHFRERYARDTAGVSITKGYSPASLCLALFDCASHTERSMVPVPPHAGVRRGEGEVIIKPRYTVALSMIAGAPLGGAVIQGLHAQAKPPAYVITHTEITDQAA